MKLSPVVRLDMCGWTANKKKTNCSLEAMSIVDLTPVDLSLCAQATCYEFAAVKTLNLLGSPPQLHMYLNLNLALLISRSVSLDPRAQECANHPQPGTVILPARRPAFTLCKTSRMDVSVGLSSKGTGFTGCAQ